VRRQDGQDHLAGRCELDESPGGAFTLLPDPVRLADQMILDEIG
jgi:hypothetical protein